MLLFKHARAFFWRFLLSRKHKIQVIARVGRKSAVVLSGLTEASYSHFFIGIGFFHPDTLGVEESSSPKTIPTRTSNGPRVFGGPSGRVRQGIGEQLPASLLASVFPPRQRGAIGPWGQWPMAPAPRGDAPWSSSTASWGLGPWLPPSFGGEYSHESTLVASSLVFLLILLVDLLIIIE